MTAVRSTPRLTWLKEVQIRLAPARPGPKATLVSLASALALVIFALGSPAAATTNPRQYSSAISPGSVSAGSTSSFTFRLTDLTAESRAIGSLNIIVPTGFQAIAVGGVQTFNADNTDAGLTWTAAVGPGGRTVQLRNPGPSTTQDLSYGQYLVVTFDAVAACAAGSYVWKTVLSQTNDFSHHKGKTFALAAGDHNPKVKVTGACGTPDHLAFGVQPSDTVAGATMAPAVTVNVLDTQDHIVSTDNTDHVTLSLGAHPTGSTLTGGGSVTVVNGVATFSGLSIDQSSSGYSLVATFDPNPAITVTSDAFDIDSANSGSNDCSSGCEVTATDPAPGRAGDSVTVEAGAGGSGGLSIVYESEPLDCGPDFHGIGGTVTINPPHDAPLPVVVRFHTAALSLPLQGSYPICKSVEQGPITTTEIVPFCSDITNGLDRYAADPDHNTAPCVFDQKITFHGSQPPSMDTILYITSTDPHGRI